MLLLDSILVKLLSMVPGTVKLCMTSLSFENSNLYGELIPIVSSMKIALLSGPGVSLAAPRLLYPRLSLMIRLFQWYLLTLIGLTVSN
jgi:hypothetical protein